MQFVVVCCKTTSCMLYVVCSRKIAQCSFFDCPVFMLMHIVFSISVVREGRCDNKGQGFYVCYENYCLHSIDYKHMVITILHIQWLLCYAYMYIPLSFRFDNVRFLYHILYAFHNSTTSLNLTWWLIIFLLGYKIISAAQRHVLLQLLLR